MKEGWRPPNWDKIKPRVNLDLANYVVGYGVEQGADAILVALEKEGIKGVVKACCNPVAMSDGDVSFDDFDTNFISENGELEICLNGAEDIIYGKQATHIITPKKGWLTFIPDETH